MKKQLTAFTAFLLAVCVTGSALAQSTDWGLSYPTPGEKPAGNASAESLLQHDSYFVGESDEKVIYLTFDAGYENGYTEQILDVLKEENVPAAFFLVGTYIRDNPELTKRMVDDGHIVGNHTMNHPNMSAISDFSAFEKELCQTEDCYRELIGEEMPCYYRPPRGVYSEENLKMAKQMGYKTIFWSLAYVDWNVDDQPSRDAAFSKLLPRVHSGAVILLHSTSQTNTEILKELIAEYRSMGYTFASIESLTA